MFMIKKFMLVAAALSAVLFLSTSAQAQELQCDNGIDDDGDTVYDCGDGDCFDDPACRPDGQPENSDKRCGDWVDNDRDGQLDCDDSDCESTPACLTPSCGPKNAICSDNSDCCSKICKRNGRCR